MVRDYYPQRKAIDTAAVPVSQMASGPNQAAGQGRPLTQAQAVPLVQRSFATLKEYSRATGQDRHSVLIDFDAFVNARATRLFGSDACGAAGNRRPATEGPFESH